MDKFVQTQRRYASRCGNQLRSPYSDEINTVACAENGGRGGEGEVMFFKIDLREWQDEELRSSKQSHKIRSMLCVSFSLV
jgi:hypothetical protein